MTNMRVAIVDDEEPARSIVREYLSACEDVDIVAECANGFEADLLMSASVTQQRKLHHQAESNPFRFGSASSFRSALSASGSDFHFFVNSNRIYE